MKKLIEYKTGEIFIMDGMSLGIAGGEIVQEIDLTHATPQEMESLRKNPHDIKLIRDIQKRTI